MTPLSRHQLYDDLNAIQKEAFGGAVYTYPWDSRFAIRIRRDFKNQIHAAYMLYGVDLYTKTYDAGIISAHDYVGEIVSDVLRLYDTLKVDIDWLESAGLTMRRSPVSKSNRIPTKKRSAYHTGRFGDIYIRLRHVDREDFSPEIVISLAKASHPRMSTVFVFQNTLTYRRALSRLYHHDYNTVSSIGWESMWEEVVFAMPPIMREVFLV